MAENIRINSAEAKKIVERWLNNDENLSLNERVFAIEKMVKKILIAETARKKKEDG